MASYSASTALPYRDDARAAASLRGQPRPAAADAGAGLGWSTRVVDGPVETLDGRGRTWFEWAATVDGQPGLGDRGYG